MDLQPSVAIYLSIYGSRTLCWGLAAFSAFRSFTQSIGLLGRGIRPSQGRYLHIGQHKHRINAQTFMPQVGFDPTIAVFERAKTVHALDYAVTVIGSLLSLNYKKQKNISLLICRETWSTGKYVFCSGMRVAAPSSVHNIRWALETATIFVKVPDPRSELSPTWIAWSFTSSLLYISYVHKVVNLCVGLHLIHCTRASQTEYPNLLPLVHLDVHHSHFLPQFNSPAEES
jgi:hypothetical protein